VTSPGRREEKVVSVVGSVYFDLVFSGFSSLPDLGREVHTGEMASTPGGCANVAVALARLNLPVALVSNFASDAFGEYLWSSLEQENIDLSYAERRPDWTTPVTVSLSYNGDRSLITHENPAPPDERMLLAAAQESRCVIIDLQTCSVSQLRAMRDAGALVVADVCWDATETWDSAILDRLALVDLFLPNAVEAMSYTGAVSPAQALALLGKHTPGTVVVKDGVSGAFAMEHGETAFAPAIEVTAVDPTGAGDVFDAAFIYGTLVEWSLSDRLRFANLCAGLSVQRHGGSLAAPCWEEVRAYCLAEGGLSRWDFLHAALAEQPSRRPCTRACPTFSLAALVEEVAPMSGGGQVDLLEAPLPTGAKH
jgi:sugar/nucleoside kinase (ribokinase family)